MRLISAVLTIGLLEMGVQFLSKYIQVYFLKIRKIIWIHKMNFEKFKSLLVSNFRITLFLYIALSNFLASIIFDNYPVNFIMPIDYISAITLSIIVSILIPFIFISAIIYYMIAKGLAFGLLEAFTPRHWHKKFFFKVIGYMVAFAVTALLGLVSGGSGEKCSVAIYRADCM